MTYGSSNRFYLRQNTKFGLGKIIHNKQAILISVLLEHGPAPKRQQSLKIPQPEIRPHLPAATTPIYGPNQVLHARSCPLFCIPVCLSSSPPPFSPVLSTSSFSPHSDVTLQTLKGSSPSLKVPTYSELHIFYTVSAMASFFRDLLCFLEAIIAALPLAY